MLHIVHHPDYASPPARDGGFTFDKYARVMGALDAAQAGYEVHVPSRMPRGWTSETGCLPSRARTEFCTVF